MTVTETVAEDPAEQRGVGMPMTKIKQHLRCRAQQFATVYGD